MTHQDWESVVERAVLRLSVELGPLKRVLDESYSVPGLIAYSVNVKSGSRIVTVQVDQIYEQELSISEDEISAGADSFFEDTVVPAVLAIAAMIRRTAESIPDPVLACVPLALPGGLSVSCQWSGHGLSLRLVRGIHQQKATQEGETAIMQYCMAENAIIPIKTPLVYITRLELAGGVASVPGYEEPAPAHQDLTNV